MKKVIITVFIIIISSAGLFSQSLEDLGYSVLSTRTEDGYTVVAAQDPSTGLTFDLYYKTMAASQLSFLREARKIILSWDYIVPKELQIVFQQKAVEIRVFPESVMFNGIDYAEYIPSTIRFFYDDVLEYDFRILVDNITLRVQGPYFNEEQLAEKLRSAVENPIAYIQTHDPEHIIRRLAEISDNLEEIKSTQSGSISDIGALEEKISGLTNELTELTEAHQALTEKYRKLQLGTIAVTNQGLFSSIKDFNKDAIDQAIELKEENPSYTEEQLLSACKDKGLKITAKEIHIIFMVYFNEF